jgi:hypothetical protein
MPLASENRHPRIALRTTLTKKPSRVTLRGPKPSPTKEVTPAKYSGSTTRGTPNSTIRSKLPEKVSTGSPTKRLAKSSVETIPIKTSIRAPKALVEVKAYEVSEDDTASDSASKIFCSHVEYSDHSSHSHPVLAIDGLSESTKHMFKEQTAKTQATPPIPKKNPRRRSQVSTVDTDADDEGSETFEDAIRSALATPAADTYHQRAHTPSSMKSVRWDPAVVSYGRVTSETQPASNGSPWIPPLSDGGAKPDFENILKTLSRLKKEEQQILRDHLRDIESPHSEDDTIIRHSPMREETKERTGLDGMFAKKLNPKAPSFGELSSTKNQTEQQQNDDSSAEKEPDHSKIQGRDPPGPVVVTSTPRKGLKVQATDRPRVGKDSKEPTWINIYNPPSLKDMPPGFAHLASNPLNHDVPQIPPSLPALAPDTMPLGWQPGFWDPNHTVWVPMPMFPTPHGYQALPVMPPNVWQNTFGLELPHNGPYGAGQNRPLQRPRRPPHKTKAATGPIVDVSLANVPPEWGPGRVAQPVPGAWGQSLIDQFRTKYPQTGKVDRKAKYQAPGQMRKAAAIQQELELLIYAEKEKAAAEEKAGIIKPKPVKKTPAVAASEKLPTSPENDPFTCSTTSTVLMDKAITTNSLNQSWNQW